jgi:hypothetical protein
MHLIHLFVLIFRLLRIKLSCVCTVSHSGVDRLQAGRRLFMPGLSGCHMVATDQHVFQFLRLLTSLQLFLWGMLCISNRTCIASFQSFPRSRHPRHTFCEFLVQARLTVVCCQVFRVQLFDHGGDSASKQGGARKTTRVAACSQTSRMHFRRDRKVSRKTTAAFHLYLECCAYSAHVLLALDLTQADDSFRA